MSCLWSVFTKPWAGLPGAELGALVAGIGFAGAEIPVRDTAYVTPANAQRELPKFSSQLRTEGVEPISVASDLSEPVFAACAEAGVPMIRIMAELGPDGYAASVRRNRELLEQAVELTERYDVQSACSRITGGTCRRRSAYCNCSTGYRTTSSWCGTPRMTRWPVITRR
ncbi:hypothetical protein [Kribbella solani]|uniref:hypothetical protein n=1 Tax=Kribbella solani TaxID=236067 RepID=UPI0038D46021